MRIFFDGDSEGTAVDLYFSSVSTTPTTTSSGGTGLTTSTATPVGRGLAAAAAKYQLQQHQESSSSSSAAAATAAAAAAVIGLRGASGTARHHFNPHYGHYNPHYNAAALVNMLTPSSNNQYLRPEYLSPLPTTLDAKKSPLALLAQTCSNIGADTPSTKSLIPPVEKGSGNSFSGGSNKDSAEKTSSSSSSSSSIREKSTPHQTDDKSSFKPYESIKKEDNGNSDTEKSGFRTPTSTKSSSPCASRAGSVHSEKGNNSRSSPSSNADKDTTTTTKSSAPSSNSDTATNVTSSGLTSNNPLSTISAPMHSQHNRISIGCGNMFVEVNHHESGLPKDALSAHLSSLGYKPGQLLPGLPPSSVLSSLSNCTGCTQVVGGHVDHTSGPNPSFNHGIGAQNSANPLKASAGGYPVGSALSPYVAYARVKTANGGTTLVPICRDPYCTNCQLSMQSAQQLVSCPSGCSQCNHEKAAAASVGLGVHHHGGGPLSGLLPGMIPGVSSSANVIPLGAGLYTSSMLTPRPYVCSWMAGDTYCGKRFTTPDELMQHLRTHTNLSAAESAALNPLLNPSLSMPSAGSLGPGAGCHLHYSMAPSLTSPAGLHRTYPTSLSPVSSLSASRYHPYKPQLAGLPGAPLTPFPPHPGFSAAAAAQYFQSPYAMYGQRLGAAVHP